MGFLIDRIKGIVSVSSPVFKSKLIEIPGIGTGAAYATGDAFGTTVVIDVPKEGTIASLIFYDLDAEGQNKELVLFGAPFTEIADNSAFQPSDADLLKCVGVIAVDLWYNYTTGQIGVPSGGPLDYVAPAGGLWGQWVTRGTDNIAAGSIPKFKVGVL